MANRKTVKGTPWTTSKVDNLFFNLRKLNTCIQKISEALGGTDTSNPDPTVSANYTGSIDDTQSLSSGTFSIAQNMRLVELQANAAGILRIDITKTDGSALQFQTFTSEPTSWSYEGLLTEAPIGVVTVTNVTGTPGIIPVIINIVSRS